MRNIERAKALMEDMQEFAPEQAKLTNVEDLVEYLDDMDSKAEKYLYMMAARIPQGIPINKYQSEFNWIYRQVMKIIDEEIRQRYN
ncbi:MAG: hypothetical protein K6C05_04375 [Anaerovibrio sp.]|uniref:hypothetical protein n=1 Tax=Anaerovibrio sp. TaxID=1872532 RepID=UPI0025D4D427|nr:hypothetical protein [Anaerovibrio sp.]MCR5176065.1 hypothetical protein [Anaerovibrio sp.]